jgi:predicted transposase/invertase (TIGR01784 family)
MLMTEWSTEVAIRVSREEGIEEGIERGRDGEKREIALKMLRLGAPIEYVAEVIGLSFAEIQSLQAQLAR